MSFPTTTEEALAVSPEKAEKYVNILFDILDEVMSKYEPPDEFVDHEANFMLAAVIDTLNRVSRLPNHPFGPGGWVAMIPDDEVSDGT